MCTIIRDYFNISWRNGPQLKATLPGAMLFLSAGMNMALGLGWSINGFYGWTKIFCCSWFIAVIIGTILSAALRNFISKKFMMAVSGLLIIIGGIIFLSAPFNYELLLVARYVNGVAIGLNIVEFLKHASEIATMEYRSTCLFTEQLAIAVGLTIQMTYTSYWSDAIHFPANRLHGLLDMMIGVSACSFLYLFFIESPVEHIRQGDDLDALACLARLQNPQGVTTEMRAFLDQHKAYVREHDSLTVRENLRLSLLPLTKMIFFRSLMLAFCYSMALNVTLKYSTTLNGQIWSPTVAGCCRIFTALIVFLLGDILPRKFTSLLTLACIGSLIIVIATIFQSLDSISSMGDMNTTLILYITVQALAGIFTPFTTVYLAEAFPLRVKPYLMDVCIIVEQLMHIICIGHINWYIADDLLVQGIIMVAVSLVLLLMMPETRHTSLAEAQRRFRKFFYIKCR